MAKLFNVAEDVSYTCETAAHFWLLHVLARWEKFSAAVAQRRTPECVKVRSIGCTSSALMSLLKLGGCQKMQEYTT